MGRLDNRTAAARVCSDGQQQFPWQLWGGGEGGTNLLTDGCSPPLQVVKLPSLYGKLHNNIDEQ